ncbi:hypothetical protein J2T56_002454 [Natronobacillus azotifigens]|uniref:DUF2933 domain-containing protein n=1 Tax=Natronobacillus azotifigens TaxID=472978 RepID=A0A9J6RG74_9BACI|nr:DUF2933 domain-containing protein [Natronobacillus azotifigens]MCZ0704161.1 DUF2933 domain-containing protein [Natronobacillus azotifigens]
MEWSLLLVLLICPLMMLFMHGSHKGHGGGNHHKQASGVEKDQRCKVKQLEEEIKILKEQNESLQKKVDVSQSTINNTK